MFDAMCSTAIVEYIKHTLIELRHQCRPSPAPYARLHNNVVHGRRVLQDRHGPLHCRSTFWLNAPEGPIVHKAEWWTTVSISSFSLYNDDHLDLFEYRWTRIELTVLPEAVRVW